MSSWGTGWWEASFPTYPPGLRRDHRQDLGAYQPVKHHDFRLFQRRPALERQQARIPRSRSHQRHFSAHASSSFNLRANPAAKSGPWVRGPQTVPRTIWSSGVT